MTGVINELHSCPICGVVFSGSLTHCGDDDLVYVATYGDPQPEGYPMTLEEWEAKGSQRRYDDA